MMPKRNLFKMTKMASMPIYGKILSRTRRPLTLGTWYVASGDVGPTKFVQIMILG